MTTTLSCGSGSSTTRSPGCSATTTTTSSGESPGVLVGPDTDLDTLRRIEAGLRREETVTAELWLHDRAGEPVRVEATYREVDTGSGATWYLSSYVDVSDRVEAAAALRRSEAWAEAMVQGSSDLVMVADPEGVIRYASPALTEVLGYELDDFVDSVFTELIHPEDAEPGPGPVRGRCAGGTSGRAYEFRVAHRDGGWRSDGHPGGRPGRRPAVRGFVVNIRDVSGPPAGRGPAGRAGRPAGGHRPRRAARGDPGQDHGDARAAPRVRHRGHRHARAPTA